MGFFDKLLGDAQKPASADPPPEHAVLVSPADGVREVEIVLAG